jgi:hypothetical protein
MRKIVVFLLMFSMLFVVSIFAKDKIVGVDVVGNTTTQKFVILNLLNYTKGMKLDVSALERAQNDLLDSGFFSDVYMSLNSSGDNYILVVNLKEKTHLSPLIDLEKGVGVKDNDIFGLGVGMYGTVRFFNVSPFSVFWGGYSIGMDSLRTFGTHFPFNVEYGDLKKLYWQTPDKSFYYDLKIFSIGSGYTWDNENRIMLTYAKKSFASTNISSDASIVETLSFEIKYASSRDESRSRWWLDANSEKGINMDFITGSLDIKNRYRIIAQIYALSRFYATFNGENTPFMCKYYFGQTSNLKGYDLREFSAPFMSLLEERIGIPLTSTFEISKSPKLTFITPEMILQSAFVSGESVSLNNFKFSIGVGLKFSSPIGDIETELFFGKSLKFYFEF